MGVSDIAETWLRLALDIELFLGSGERRLGSVHLGFRCAVLGDRVVDLLRHQARTGGSGLLQAYGRGVQSSMIGFVTSDFIPGPRDLFRAVAYRRVRALHLGGQFRYFQNRKRLPRVHAVANIDIDVLDVSRNLGVDFYFLIGIKLTRHGEGVGQRLAFHQGDSGARNDGAGRMGGGAGADSAYDNDAGHAHKCPYKHKEYVFQLEPHMFFRSEEPKSKFPLRSGQ